MSKINIFVAYKTKFFRISLVRTRPAHAAALMELDEHAVLEDILVSLPWDAWPDSFPPAVADFFAFDGAGATAFDDYAVFTAFDISQSEPPGIDCSGEAYFPLSAAPELSKSTGMAELTATPPAFGLAGLVETRKKQRKKAEGMPSKNLMAERRRRKRLNERLSLLRSIVPKISKVLNYVRFCDSFLIYARHLSDLQ